LQQKYLQKKEEQKGQLLILILFSYIIQ